MSVLIYNGVQLPYANTSNFMQKAVYEDSKTDRILTEFDIQVTCLVSSDYAGLINPRLGNATSNPADFMAWMRQILLAQRQRLIFLVNGVNLIPNVQVGNPGIVDAANGPQPQHFNITQVTETLFLVDYRIIAKYWENNNGALPSVPVTDTNNPGGQILYNRWQESVTVDTNLFSVRTRRGKFMIRSDNTGGFLADQLRAQFAIVGVPAGFTRTRNEYTIDPSGLILSYTQEDTEQYKLPPSPAYTAEGRARMLTSYGAVWHVETHVKLTGATFTSQMLLLQMAIYISVYKMTIISNNLRHAQGGGNQPIVIAPAPYQIERVSAEIDLYKNEVSVDFRFFIAKSAARVNLLVPPSVIDNVPAALVEQEQNEAEQGVPLNNPRLPNWLDMFAGISNYTPISDATNGLGQALNPSPVYYAYGNAGLLLEAASYYDPSINEAQLSQQQSPGRPGNTIPNQPGIYPSQMSTVNGGITTFLPQPGQGGANGP